MERWKLVMVILITTVWFAHFYGMARHGIALLRYYRECELERAGSLWLGSPAEIDYDAPVWWRVEGAALALSAWGIASALRGSKQP